MERRKKGIKEERAGTLEKVAPDAIAPRLSARRQKHFDRLGIRISFFSGPDDKPRFVMKSHLALGDENN